MVMRYRFLEALRSAECPLIMEIKLRGAHGEDLLGGRSVGDIVGAYEAAGAPCLSVVTGSWFGGNDALLQAVDMLTDRPLLKKDLITSEHQVVAAQKAGASAVLLTASFMPRLLLNRLTRFCLQQQITPFIEVRDVADLDGLQAEDCGVAVNNKDIARQERGVWNLPAVWRCFPRYVAAGRAVRSAQVASARPLSPPNCWRQVTTLC